MLWFTSDTHFGHSQIGCGPRGFGHLEHHDDCLLTGINDAVGLNDCLYILGDFAWFGAKRYLERIECKNVFLVIGYHDRGSHIKAFKGAEDTYLLKHEGQKFFLSHYPHAYWPSSHRGSYHLYGHVHSEYEDHLDQLFPDRRSMDVGMDNAQRLLGDYRPFHVWEIMTYMKGREGHHKPKEKWVERNN